VTLVSKSMYFLPRSPKIVRRMLPQSVHILRRGCVCREPGANCTSSFEYQCDNRCRDLGRDATLWRCIPSYT
jgi:hypothetical protein